MPSLYNCRHDGDQYRISKFDTDWNVEASYLCDLDACECPAGHRPTCRHRQMLSGFILREHIGDEWFYDFDRGGWVQGASKDIEPSTLDIIAATHDEAIAQQEIQEGLVLLDSLGPAGLGQASDLEANLTASNEELIVQAKPLNLHQPRQTSEQRPFLEGISQSVASTIIYTTDEPPLPIVRVDLRVPVEPDPPEPTKHELKPSPSPTTTIRRRV